MSTTKKRAPSTKSTHFGSFIPPQTQHFLQAQQQIGEEFQLFTTRWAERRRDAAQALIEASDEASPPDQTLFKVPAILPTWQATSIQCISEDVRDWLGLWSTCSRILTAEELDVVSDLATAAGLTSEPDKLPTRIPV